MAALGKVSTCQYLHKAPKSNKINMRKCANEKCDPGIFDHFSKFQVKCHKVQTTFAMY